MINENDSLNILNKLMSELITLPLDMELNVIKDIIDRQLDILSKLSAQGYQNPSAIKSVIENMSAEYESLTLKYMNEAEVVRGAIKNVKSIQQYLVKE